MNYFDQPPQLVRAVKGPCLLEVACEVLENQLGPRLLLLQQPVVD